MRPVPALVLLPLLGALLAGCGDPGFIPTANPGPTPTLLPIDEILSGDSAQLDAEAATALTARGEVLRAKVETASEAALQAQP